MKKQLFMVLTLCAIGIGAMAQPRSASQPRKLIESPSGLMAPVWSPAGDKIAVTTDNFTGILIADADGSNLKSLTTEPGAGYKMTWSADGKQIMGRVNVVEGVKNLHETKVWDVANGQSAIVKAKSASTAVPSWDAADGVYKIMVNDPAKAASQIEALKDYAGSIVINPALSPDGKKVAFQLPGKGIWTINNDGTGLKQLCSGSHPQWLPDNKSIIMTIVKDNGQNFTSSDIYAVNAETGDTNLLTGDTDILPLTPTVSPDGKQVAFENALDAAIYVITLKY